jgi:hypothetical protein
LTLPDVPPSVCYPSGRRRQRRGPKPGGQRSLDPRIGRERVSRPGDCQHHGGRELAVRDMVNPGEVLIKAVMGPINDLESVSINKTAARLVAGRSTA